MTLSTKPPRGTADRLPEEFRIRNYIFSTWKKVCEQFCYDQYLGPLVEDSAIWKAKSGEDVGGSELTLLTDREGNVGELALRPEMTPTVTRMISRSYRDLPKPVRRFSIANFYRNERPQRGRNREFRQLNVDLFGETGIQADVEILTMAIELMKAFDATSEQFVVYLNDRTLVDSFLTQFVKLDEVYKTDVIRTMDKRDKLTLEKFEQTLIEKGLTIQQVADIVDFMQAEEFRATRKEHGLTDNITDLIDYLGKVGYGDYIQFKPSLMRGFDYYDGMVFEVFDLHEKNNRALFGGGRYNGLSEIFGVKEPIPAVGFAPGDETMKLFLESRGMVDSILETTAPARMYLPLLDNELSIQVRKLAQQLRDEGKQVEISLGVKKLGKSFQYAEKKGYHHIVILGPNEVAEGIYLVKELATGNQESFPLS